MGSRQKLEKHGITVSLAQNAEITSYQQMITAKHTEKYGLYQLNLHI